MFDELVKQARRLFSTKSNGGKQVPQLTDRLHTYKQVIVALSIVLMLGYAQFREHFRCRGYGDLDWKTTTNFCLLNGTTTVVREDASGQSAASPHVGIGFKTTKNDRVIGHNYMRSYWPLLILLAVCSHLAQRRWAALFKDDMLRALLQLVGSEELRQVRAAESAKPYEMLSSLSSDLSKELKKLQMPADHLMKGEEMSRNERVMRRIDLVDRYVNIYDHTLDYYPNQLTYLLLTKNAASYKLSCLKLRSKLLYHSLLSTNLSLVQFLLPLVFLGNSYALYGWRYLCAASSYLVQQLTSSDSAAQMVNSIDYELSSELFPINAQCEYQQYGMTGATEVLTVQCTVAINEICAKLFVVIWWIVALSGLVELWSLCSLALASVSLRTISWAFGLRFWPHARQQADLIATFRHKRSILRRRAQLIRQLRRAPPKLAGPKQLALGNGSEKAPAFLEAAAPAALSLKLNNSLDGGVAAGTFARKRGKLQSDFLSYGLEHGSAGAGDDDDDDECARLKQQAGRDKRWYMYSPRDMVKLSVELVCCRSNKRRERLDSEAEKDINIYYLLYLVHLRLGGSKSKVEEVIRMTACALSNYLAELEARCEQHKLADKIEDHDHDHDHGEEDDDDHDDDHDHGQPEGSVDCNSMNGASDHAMKMC